MRDDGKRAELEAKIRELAERVAGTGHPNAPGVMVQAHEPARMQPPDSPAVKQAERSYDTVVHVRVNDEDAEKAATFALRIQQVLETEWVEAQLGQPPRIVPGTDPAEFDVLFLLGDGGSEPGE